MNHPFRLFLGLALLVAFSLPMMGSGQSLDDLLEKPPTPDPTTITVPGGVPTVPTPDQPTADTSVDDIRRKIVELAQAEVGKVDTRPGPDGFKTGWQRLVEYYEQAYRIDNLETAKPYWYKMLKKPHSYIEGGPKHWCGIFTTWAWSKAELAVHWDTRIIGCKYRGDTKNIQVGDICIIKKEVNPNNHHCVVKSRNGNALVTIDGNQNAQNVLERNRLVSGIEIYYSVADVMGVPVTTPPVATQPPPKPGPKTDPKTDPKDGPDDGTALIQDFLKIFHEYLSGPPGKSTGGETDPAQESFLQKLAELIRGILDLFF